MIGGTRQKAIGNANAYRNDPLYPFAKSFTEACQNILQVEHFDMFAEPSRAMRQKGVTHALKEFFCKDFVNEADTTKTAEQIEDEIEGVKEQFQNDIEAALTESAYMSEYSPMVGMALPIHKLILMNNVFSQGGGIQKVTAVQPAFPISMERRFLVKPNGEEIDMAEQQNEIFDAVNSTAPLTTFELTLPEENTTDIIGELGGGIKDELSVETHISGIYVENVYFAEGDRLPDEDGWYSPNKGKIATAADAGLRNVWFRVQLNFTPSYGGPNRLERTLSKPVTIEYKTSATEKALVKDTLFGAMHKNQITIISTKGVIKKVRLAARLSTTNANLDECSVRWKLDTDYIEIPEAKPINTTVTPEEVKDIAAMYDASQVTKIMSMTKVVLSEVKDKYIKNFLDASYQRLDERRAFAGEFDFATPEGYALDHVTHRMATFMDFLDDLVTRMLQVYNDPNVTVTIYGDPRVVRKVTPTEYTYVAPSAIGDVVLDYSQTIVNTKDRRVYNFIGSDKMRNTNELMIILNPRNSDRIMYRLYDYQLYISNEIRNAENPQLPAIHAFERYLMTEYFSVQSRVNILNPSGLRK